MPINKVVIYLKNKPGWFSSQKLSIKSLVQSKKENPLLPGFSFLSLYEKSMMINIEKILFVIYSFPGFYKK
jgi:hypothetical protein